MRERGSGTVVTVSSIMGRMGFPGQGAYCASKFALEGLTETLRLEVREHGVDAALVEPGPIETRFGETALERKGDREITGAYGWFDEMYDDRTSLDRMPGSLPPTAVAETILEAAESPDPDARYLVGPHAKLLSLGTVVPERARERAFGLLRRSASD